jgi:hypothetical protein
LLKIIHILIVKDGVGGEFCDLGVELEDDEVQIGQVEDKKVFLEKSIFIFRVFNLDFFALLTVLLVDGLIWID